MHKEGVGNFRTLRLLGDGDGDDSSSSSDDDDNVTSLHIHQDLILKASGPPPLMCQLSVLARASCARGACKKATLMYPLLKGTLLGARRCVALS